MHSSFPFKPLLLSVTTCLMVMCMGTAPVQGKVAFHHHFKQVFQPLEKKVKSLEARAKTPYKKVLCRKLDTYKGYLQHLIKEEGAYGTEGAQPRVLLQHPYCNAAAIRTAKKNDQNRRIWTKQIEPLFQEYFGHPSGLFEGNTKSKAFIDRANIHSEADLKQALQEKYKNVDTIFILSIDGGGIRGIIPATILAHIQKETGVKITDAFQFYIGTSTGGLIVLFLNTPDDDGRPRYDINETLDIYKELGKVAFARGALHRRIRGMGGVFTSKYSAKPLENLLRSKFHDYTMAQTVNPVTVVSINQSTRQPFLFSTLNALLPSENHNFFMWQAGRATSAAPTFFKPFTLSYKVGDRKKSITLIDGGVGINNPGLAAYANAKKVFEGHRKRYVLLSLGTGTTAANAKITSTGALSGGAATNLGSIISNFGDSSANFNNDVLQAMVESDGGFFVRINPVIGKKEAAMDNVTPKNLKNLEGIAEDVLRAHKVEIDVLINIIKAEHELRQMRAEGNHHLHQAGSHKGSHHHKINGLQQRIAALIQRGRHGRNLKKQHKHI